MDSKNNSINTSSDLSHGSLQQIKEKGGPVKFEPNEKWPQSRFVEKKGQAAYLKRVSGDLELPQQQSKGRDVSPERRRKISEPGNFMLLQRQISQGRRRAESESKSLGGLNYPPGPLSPTTKRAFDFFQGQMRRGSECQMIPAKVQLYLLGGIFMEDEIPTNRGRMTEG